MNEVYTIMKVLGLIFLCVISILIHYKVRQSLFPPVKEATQIRPDSPEYMLTQVIEACQNCCTYDDEEKAEAAYEETYRIISNAIEWYYQKIMENPEDTNLYKKLLARVYYGRSSINSCIYKYNFLNTPVNNANVLDDLEKALSLFIETNSYKDVIGIGFDFVSYYSGYECRFSDYFQVCANNDQDNMIAVCTRFIDYGLEHNIKEGLDDFYYNRGIAYEYKGNYEAAIENYREALKIEKDEEYQERLDNCLEKLKGNNDNI